MFDIKVDDYTDLGPVVYARSSGGGKGFTFDLINLSDGKMYIPNFGVASTKAQNSVGKLEGNRWITMAVVYNFSTTSDAASTDDENYRVCPTCYKKYAYS